MTKETPKPKSATGDVAEKPAAEKLAAEADKGKAKQDKTGRPREIGGPEGPEPTRYGDWERNGRVSDF